MNDGHETSPAPELGPMADTPVDESMVAISGIAAFIYTRLLARVENKTEEKLDEHGFILEVGDEARTMRKFGDDRVLELPESPKEKMASSYRHYQVRRIRKIESAIYGLRLLWGEKSSAPTTDPPVVPVDSSKISRTRQTYRPERLDQYAATTRSRVKNDSATEVNFEPRPGENRQAKKAREKNKLIHEKLQLKKRKLNESIDRGVSGDTFFARRRTKKIERLIRKQIRYAAKLGRQ